MNLKKLLIVAFICCSPSLFAQTLTVTKDFAAVPNSSVLAMYKNQFGKWEKPDLDDTFPYAVIRVALEGNAREVREAKKKLGLYLGTQRMVVDMYADKVNELLFLVPSGAGHIELQCGDGCKPITIIDLPRLRSNTLYSGIVHYVPAEELIIASQGPRLQDFTLQVEPQDAKVEIIHNGVKQEWVLIDGKAQLSLANGEYHYTISARNHQTRTGYFDVSQDFSEAFISLVPNYGWLTITDVQSALKSLSVEITHANEKMTKSLPLTRMQCDKGVYLLTIKKPRYHTWKDSVEVIYGVESKLSPVLLPKQYKHNTYLLAEGGLAFNPNWSAGLMVGQTYGEEGNKVGAGWYVKARSNFQFQRNTSGLVAGEGGKVNGELMYYTGNKKASMWMVNAGLLLNFLHSKSANSAFGMYLGAGYGSYTSLWEMTNGEWVEYGYRSAHGVSCGAGLIGSIKGFTLSAGVNTIGFKYLEAEVGIGWMF